jgi:uncharacterized protein (DUF3084 family)
MSVHADEQNSILARRAAELASTEAKLSADRAQVQQLLQELASRDAVEAQEQELQGRMVAASQHEQEVQEREAELHAKVQQLNQQEAELQARAHQHNQQEAELQVRGETPAGYPLCCAALRAIPSEGPATMLVSCLLCWGIC